jgi:hypothetical protein
MFDMKNLVHNMLDNDGYEEGDHYVILQESKATRKDTSERAQNGASKANPKDTSKATQNDSSERAQKAHPRQRKMTHMREPKTHNCEVSFQESEECVSYMVWLS